MDSNQLAGPERSLGKKTISGTPSLSKIDDDRLRERTAKQSRIRVSEFQRGFRGIGRRRCRRVVERAIGGKVQCALCRVAHQFGREALSIRIGIVLQNARRRNGQRVSPAHGVQIVLGRGCTVGLGRADVD